MQNFLEILNNHPYPGRGIMLGKTADGSKSVVVYFIMGRSENSRNRIFETTEDGIRTKAFDESKMVDPSLIIYHPVRKVGTDLVVTNGDQTDTVRDGVLAGEIFAQSLRKRTFEPDGPNWTPRISGLLCPDGSYKLSILKSADPEGSACTRHFFDYPPIAGLGHFLHTYVCDGNPIPTFQGEPERVAMCDDMDSFAAGIWENLNPNNKISLYVRYTDRATGESRQKIYNKHHGE